MLHRTYEDITSSVGLALKDQPKDAWILDRIRERAVVLPQGGRERIEKIGQILEKKERVIALDFEASDVSTQHDSSIVANDHVSHPNGDLPIIRIAPRPCDRFWFGLKFGVEVMLFERSFDYGEMKVEVMRQISNLAPTKRETRRQLAEFCRQSREHLEMHVAETQLMYPSLVYRAVNRELEGALERVIPQMRSHCAIIREQKLLVTMLAQEIMELTQEAFPPPMSIEEEAARSILLALASSHVAHAALAPSIQH